VTDQLTGGIPAATRVPAGALTQYLADEAPVGLEGRERTFQIFATILTKTDFIKRARVNIPHFSHFLRVDLRRGAKVLEHTYPAEEPDAIVSRTRLYGDTC
jgi:hypothetical protein